MSQKSIFRGTSIIIFSVALEIQDMFCGTSSTIFLNFWHWCLYPHMLRYSVSLVCGIFFSSYPKYCYPPCDNKSTILLEWMKTTCWPKHALLSKNIKYLHRYQIQKSTVYNYGTLLLTIMLVLQYYKRMNIWEHWFRPGH